MQFATKKINNEVVKAIRFREPDDKRPIKGGEIFPIMYSNIALVARKMSGKTCTIMKILQSCCMPGSTKIIAFVSTLHKDPAWDAIQAWCAKKGLSFMGATSLEEDGVDLLEQLTETLKAQNEAIVDTREPEGWLSEEEEPAKEPKKPKRSKYQAQDLIIILDDLSNELKTSSLVTLLKNHRHFKCKTLVSTQYKNDILPQSYKQMDYWILFKGHARKKLEEIYYEADMAVPFETFERVYNFATEKPFSFLYYSKGSGTFRRNFDTLILL